MHKPRLSYQINPHPSRPTDLLENVYVARHRRRASMPRTKNSSVCRPVPCSGSAEYIDRGINKHTPEMFYFPVHIPARLGRASRPQSRQAYKSRQRSNHSTRSPCPTSPPIRSAKSIQDIRNGTWDVYLLRAPMCVPRRDNSIFTIRTADRAWQ